MKNKITSIKPIPSVKKPTLPTPNKINTKCVHNGEGHSMVKPHPPKKK